MIYSGEHLVYGALDLDGPADEALDDWRRARGASDRFEARDLAWWTAEVALAEGPRVCLYESSRSNTALRARVRALVDFLCGRAREGEVVLQHRENGVARTRWRVRDGTVDLREEQDTTLVPAPRALDEVRRTLQARIDAHTEIWNGRTPRERFEEVVARHVPRRSAVLLVGGDDTTRPEALLEVRRAMGQGDPPVREAGDLTQLSAASQLALCDDLREGRVRVLAWVSGPTRSAHDAVHPALWHRLSVGLVDLDEVHP